jgi:hypothetical protein
MRNNWATGSVQIGNLTASNNQNFLWSGFILGNVSQFLNGNAARFIWNYETSLVAGDFNVAIRANTSNMLEDTATGIFRGYGSNTWEFESASYPTLKNNFANADLQLAHQSAGHLYLAKDPNAVTTSEIFLGGVHIQDDITVDVADFEAEFAIFDTNSAATNDVARADFFACELADNNPDSIGDILLTTMGINEAAITLKIAEGTSEPSDWRAIRNTGDDACVIEKHTVGIPEVNEKLNLIAEVMKGGEKVLKKFSITFQ